MGCCGRQLGAILWKNWLLKVAGKWSTVAELLLPVGFMALLILIKSITSVYDSPDIAYHCGNSYPWQYGSSLSTEATFPYSCLVKPAQCEVDNYYRSSFEFVTPNGTTEKAYEQLGYVDSAATSGGASTPFYTYTIADEATVYSDLGVDNPSLPLSFILSRLQQRGVKLAMAPETYSASLYAQVQDMAQYLVNKAGTQYADAILFFNSQDDINTYITDRDYDDEGYKSGKIAMAITLYAADIPKKKWDYAIRTNYSYDFERQESVSCLYGETDDCPFTYTIPRTEYDTFDLFKPQTTENLYGYTFSGFSTLQEAVDEYIYSVHGYTVNVQGSVSLMPTLDYLTDNFQYVISSTLGLFYMLSFLYPVSRIIRGLVVEKEQRIKEGMKMMGLSDMAYNMSWLITISLQLTLVSLLITLVTSTSVFEYSDKFLVFIYFMSFSFAIMNFCFMLATFFSRSKIASLVGPMLFFGTFFPYYAVMDPDYSTSTKASACLLAPTCFALGANVFADYEGGLVGVQSDNASTETSGFTYSLCVSMLIVDGFIYGILAWYFDKVIPSEFGTSLPIWFPFLPSYWLGEKGKHDATDSDVKAGLDKTLLDGNAAAEGKLEPVAPELLALGAENRSVSVRSLRKVFQTTDNQDRVAVKGLTMDFYEGQCTVLLGHNGAGKSTTMSMLTGLTPCTSGDAFIRGMSVRTQMQDIRNELGVCPQHDILFPELTVRQHLRMFAAFKGVPSDQVEGAVERMIAEVGLKEKADYPSSNLSGGQKRKLSVGIALIGDSKVVILDEPTSGMDPFSRRSTWNIIQKNKRNRIILLTTHFMDEADILGDRIAIMSHGELRCFGSPLFLKKTYGVGYSFTIEKSAVVASLSKEITETVKKHVADAEILSNVGAEQSFRLPFQASDKFVALFNELDSRKESLKIAEYGISVTTLEEVFIRVGRDNDPYEAEQRASIQHIRSRSSSKDPQLVADLPEAKVIASAPSADKDDEPVVYGTLENDTAWVTFIKHFKALFAKRIIYGKRDKRMFVCQLVLPTILVILGLGLLLLRPPFGQDEIILTPSVYNGDFKPIERNFVPFNTFGGSLGEQLADRFNGDSSNGVYGVAVPVSTTPDAFSSCANGPNALLNMSSYLINEVEPSSEKGSSRYGAVSIASESNETNLYYNVMVNGSAVHAVGIYINLIHSALLQVLSGEGTATIQVRNNPLPRTFKQDQQYATMDAFTAAIFIMIAFCFIPASYASFIVKEREVKAKHQQIISGVSIYAYWVSSFVFDVLSYIPTVAMVMILCLIYGFDSFTENSGGGATFLLFMLFGPAVAAFTYVVSFAFKSHSTAQLMVMFGNFITGLCLMIVSFVLTLIPSTTSINVTLRYLFRLFPSFCLGDALTQLALCEAGRNCPSIDENGYNYDKLVSPYDWSVIGANLTFLAFEAIIYFAIAVFMEWSLTFPKIVAMVHHVDDSSYDPNSARNDPLEDPDVAAERKRVLRGDADGDVVKIDELRKVYNAPTGQKVAVRSLSFGIPKGECFGFLGINGAGKTTTLSILSGEFPPTSGTAFIDGCDISLDQSKIRRKIGYCPQFDALLELLTVREHLELYARIKGIPQDSLEGVVRSKMKQLDLVNFENKAAGSLSGGNKRKLSVAIALIGEPSIVFLDEPSTGMDPVARRFMWEVISRVSTQDAKCSIILTTHSMEEAEALCGRIGIMVNGRLRCLGSSQHLKVTYGSGYEVDLKTKFPTLPQLMQLANNLESNGIIELKKGDANPMNRVESAQEMESEEILTTTTITMEEIKRICSALMESERAALIAPNREGAGIYTAIEADGHVSLKNFLDWWVAENYACRLADFMEESFRGAVLLERSTAHSFRYRIPTADVNLASVFGKFEQNKSTINLEDYSVGQTTLEQIFNEFASSQDNPEMEAEHLRQQAMRSNASGKKTGSQATGTSSSLNSLEVMGPMPTFKRVSTNGGLMKKESLTGGVF